MNLDPSKLNVTGVMSSTPDLQIKQTGEKKKQGELFKTVSNAQPEEQLHIDQSLFKSSKRKVKLKKGEAYSKSLRNDEYEMQDGFDSSRDISGVYSFEGPKDQPYRFRVDLTRLRPGAEKGNLDVYTLISLGKGEGKTSLPDNIPGVTSQPWNIALGKYDNKNFKAIDDNGNPMPHALSGVKFDPLHNSVEFNLNKAVLRDKGWKDGEPLKLQVFTAKDFVKKVTDSLDEPSKKPWANEGKMTRFMDTSRPTSLDPGRDDNWADDIIYFLLTDRFEDGDKSNNMDVDKNDLRRYQGGDIQGIINKMDYIKSLGVSTIWLTPVFDNQTDFVNSSGYHGYWPIDLYKVDEHQGDMKKFKEMVDIAHKKGLKVILDIPLNHVAWEHPFTKDPKKHDWFHHIGDIEDWNDPHQIENGSMYGLPDLAQENPEVYKYLLDMSKYWIKETNVDGFRLDAVMHVPRKFWDKYTEDIKKFAGPDFIMVGEVFHGDPNRLAPYQSEGMPSLFDMPLYFTIRDTFAHDDSMRNLADRVQQLEAKYENPSMMAAIIDNHDTNRFMTEAGNNAREKTKLALAFLLTINRIPAIYYGTEAAMEGHEEKMGLYPPENRAMMQFGGDPEMEKYMKNLIRVRNNSLALKEGALLEMWRDNDIYAFSRMHPDEEVIVALNNSYQDQHREIPLRKESALKNGDILKDIISGREITIQNNKIKLNLGRKQPAVLIPKKK